MNDVTVKLETWNIHGGWRGGASLSISAQVKSEVLGTETLCFFRMQSGSPWISGTEKGLYGDNKEVTPQLGELLTNAVLAHPTLSLLIEPLRKAGNND